MRNVDVDKGSKYNQTIEAKPKAVSSNPPVIVATAALAIAITIMAWWTYNHVSGGCIGLKDWFNYCSVTITK